MNNESDLDVDFYKYNVSNVEANYFSMTKVKNLLTGFGPNVFLVLLLKHFEIFNEFIKN